MVGLRRVAARRWQSLAAVVRDAVHRMLERERTAVTHERVGVPVGGPVQVRANRRDPGEHDRHLAEALDPRSAGW